MAGDSFEQDQVRDEVEQQLAQTSFQCSSLSRLSGGTANFVYRGTPLNGNPESIIIKHTKNYLSSNASFKLDAERCVSVRQQSEKNNVLTPFSILKVPFSKHWMDSSPTIRQRKSQRSRLVSYILTKRQIPRSSKTCQARSI
jgi:hypothetical protein